MFTELFLGRLADGVFIERVVVAVRHAHAPHAPSYVDIVSIDKQVVLSDIWW